MRVLVCGSRSWRNYGAVIGRLNQLPKGSEILHGAAKGADTLAHKAALALGMKVTAYPAPWTELGKRAGVVRSMEMLDENPDLVIAFWDGESRGTSFTLGEAARRGIPTEVIV